VDALARLQLVARRHRRRLVLIGPCGRLQELVEQCGLSAVLPCAETPLDRPPPGSALEPIGQPEEREPAGRVEEERDPGDPVP
jgi:hypothetical protein